MATRRGQPLAPNSPVTNALPTPTLPKNTSMAARPPVNHALTAKSAPKTQRPQGFRSDCLIENGLRCRCGADHEAAGQEPANGRRPLTVSHQASPDVEVEATGDPKGDEPHEDPRCCHASPSSPGPTHSGRPWLLPDSAWRRHWASAGVSYKTLTRVTPNAFLNPNAASKHLSL